jgi:hypothetical protein
LGTRRSVSPGGIRAAAIALSNRSRRNDVAKGQRKSNKEVRKPKKPEPPKLNASNPSAKGTPVKTPV